MKRGIVDLSSLIWTALLKGKDVEFGREVINGDGKAVWVNSAQSGFETAVDFLISAMNDIGLTPHQLIFVVEGKNSKAGRLALLPSYKGDRSKLPEQYEEFNRAKEMVLEQFLSLGAQACWQDGGVEADDVIAYLARNLYGYRYIISNDKDLAQLVGPGPRDRLRPYSSGQDTTRGRGLDDSPWTGYIHQWRQGQLDKNPFGPFPHNLIPVAIALVGDTSDKIPGARLFGEKALESLLMTFGVEGLSAMERLIKTRRLMDLQEDVAELKVLQRVIDSADAVYLSYNLACLWHEKVNTPQRELNWRVGMVKRRTQDTDDRLRTWAGAVSIVSAENHDRVVPGIKRLLASSPYVSLDIETSTPPESDEWLARLNKSEDKTPVDVFGSELTSLQLTFGPNLQYTAYFPVDNVETENCHNLTIDQVREIVEAIPKTTFIYIHNTSFELPVLFNTWGKKWADDPDWHGFIPNALDTAIGSSYVDENRPRGLKALSSRLLNHTQIEYAEVTTKHYPVSEWKPLGRWNQMGRLISSYREQVPTGTFETDYVESVDEDGLVTIVPTQGAEITADGREMVVVQRKMNELTAEEVLDYGADDTICTAALANHFRTIMEVEDTWFQYLEIEQLPAYVTAKAFIDGADFSLERMAAMEKEDNAAYEQAWGVLRKYLIDIGFEGTSVPQFTEITPAAIKEAHKIVLGEELKTMVRTNSKLAKLIRQNWEGHEQFGNAAELLAKFIEDNNVEGFNAIIKQNFNGEPEINLGSPKQMRRLLYDHMGLPVRIANPPTDKQKEASPELAAAMARFYKKRAGSDDIVLTEEELLLIKDKAKTDDVAIDTALAFDHHLLTEKTVEALKAVGVMKTVTTRRNLFYANYWNALHWKDGKIHASTNQCAAVTRRYSMSNPNLQQLPKKGEGVKFRGCFLPHHRRAVICSIDFSGQELRLAAERSQDPNLLSCYVGDNLRDVHSLTAAFAMKLKWGPDTVRNLYTEFAPDLVVSEETEYTLFRRLHALGKKHPMGKKADDLRKESKNVNFTAQFGGSAPKISETLIMSLEDAQLFLEARSAMFPLVEEAADRAAEECSRKGYALTLMGVRRHLNGSIRSDDREVSARAERQAWNFEIQGSAGEMTKLAMARLWKSGALHRYDARVIAPIHDELVTSVAAEDALEFIKVKHACMTAPYSTMKVPILGSISVGPDFAAQIECGDWYIPENISAALDDIFAEKEAA